MVGGGTVVVEGWQVAGRTKKLRLGCWKWERGSGQLGGRGDGQ